MRFTPAAVAAYGADFSVARAPQTLSAQIFFSNPDLLCSASVQILPLVVMAGVSFHMYQQISYMILSRVTPVTHSIGNCVKRVVVIVSSVIFFGTPVRCARLRVRAHAHWTPLLTFALLCTA